MLVRTFASEKRYLEDYVLTFWGDDHDDHIDHFSRAMGHSRDSHLDGARPSTSKGWVEYIDLQAVSRLAFGAARRLFEIFVL